jgi:hypothetical protein
MLDATPLICWLRQIPDTATAMLLRPKICVVGTVAVAECSQFSRGLKPGEVADPTPDKAVGPCELLT